MNPKSRGTNERKSALGIPLPRGTHKNAPNIMLLPHPPRIKGTLKLRGPTHQLARIQFLLLSLSVRRLSIAPALLRFHSGQQLNKAPLDTI